MWITGLLQNTVWSSTVPWSGPRFMSRRFDRRFRKKMSIPKKSLGKARCIENGKLNRPEETAQNGVVRDKQTFTVSVIRNRPRGNSFESRPEQIDGYIEETDKFKHYRTKVIYCLRLVFWPSLDVCVCVLRPAEIFDRNMTRLFFRFDVRHSRISDQDYQYVEHGRDVLQVQK